MHEYKVNILKVVDGDTVDVDIDLGFGMWLRNERVRVMGIDTPESRTSDKIEKIFGLAAKNRLISLLGAEAILHTQVSKKGEDMKGKFGRVLGNFTSINGEKCAAVLIREGHAVAYQGGSKENVASQHLANRQKLITEGTIHWSEVGAESFSDGLNTVQGIVKNPAPLEPNDAPIVKTATPKKTAAKKTTKKKTAKKK
jgi:micrococcal nuclease